MAVVSDVEIRLRADIARLQQDMTSARGVVTGALGSMSQSVERFKSILGGLAVGAVFKDLGSQVIGAQREFDKFNSALVTATGSTDKANKAFAALQNFAATTPFDLKQTVDAFLKLRNMGLDPSERALRSYGNTAGALGKSLNQMVEAVADAATGEFERLKEFGIRAAQNGETVRLTFQGMSTTVANNAKAIQGYLLKLGETKFAGGMELQAKTLDGAISNLGDSWRALLRTVSQSGFGDAANTGVRKLTGALESLAAQIKDGGPITEGLKLAAKLTAAYVAAMAAPAVLAAFSSALATIGLNLSLIKLELRAGMGLWGLFNTTLYGTSVAAGLAAGSLTKLQVAASVLFAAFAGWEIGKYLNDNFYQARVAGEVFVGAMLTGWENIKYGAQVAWTVIETGFSSTIGAVKRGFSDFLKANAKALDLIGAGDKAKALNDYADGIRAAADAQMDLSTKMALLGAAHDKTIALINKETDARVAASVIQGQISEADRQQAGNALQGIDAKAEATKEALDWYKKTMEASKDTYDVQAQEAIGAATLTAEEKKRVEVLNDLARVGKSLSAKQKQDITEYQDTIVLLAKLNDARAQDVKIRKELIEAAQKEVDAARDQTRSLEEQIKYYGLTEEAVLRLKAAELGRRADMELDTIEEDKLRRLAVETAKQADAQKKLAGMKANTQFWTGMESAAHDMFMSIDKGNTNLWQRMKDSAKNMFFEWLYQMTVKKWIINIGAEISGTSGVSGIAGAAGILGGDSSGGGAAGMFSSLSSMYSAGKALYSGFSTGIASSLGTMIQGMGQTFGSAAVTSFGAGMQLTTAEAAAAAGTSAGAAGGGALSAGASAASMVPVIGWIIAGMMANNSYFKQGWKIDNQKTDITKELLASSLKGNFLGPIGATATVGIGAADTLLRKIGLSDQLASLFSGSSLWAKAFGRQTPTVETQGLKGNINAGGVDAYNYATVLEKGGWFRSDQRTDLASGISHEADLAFDTTMQSMIKAVKGFGSVLGIETANIGAYTKSFDIKLTGDAAKDNATIAQLFADVGNELSTNLVPSLSKFAAEGETASATLQRLVADYMTVDNALAAIGKTMGVVGEAGIAAREGLITAAGGLDKLTSGISYFQQNFLTQAEQLAPVQKQVAEALAAMGKSGLQTNEQFKAAALGIDLTTQAGQELFAKMMALAPAFKVVADASEAAAKAAADEAIAKAQATAAAEAAAAAAKTQALKDNETLLRGQIGSALDQLKTAVDARKDALKASFDDMMAGLSASIDSWSAKITDLKSLSALLAGAKVGATQTSASRASAQAQLESAFAIAKTSGVLPSADSIKDAISAVSADSSNQFSTLIEYQRDQARASRSIAGLAGLTDDQLSTAEKTLQVLQNQKAGADAAYARQISALDAIVAAGDKAASIALGTYQAILSVDAGIATLAAAIAALKLGATPGNPTGAGMSVADLYATVLGRTADATGLAYWQKVFGESVDASEYAQFIAGAAPELAAKANGTWSQWLAEHGAGGTAPTGQGNGMQTALDTFNTQVSSMQASLDRTAKSTQQLADQFNQVSAGGNALITESV